MRFSWAALQLSVVLVFLCVPVTGARGQLPEGQAGSATNQSTEAPERNAQLNELKHAAQRLPLAAVLAAILALRPRRKGTPLRKPAVVQTQIVLALIGALVMLVVGGSLARAFGIVGAAGLVRYRAKVNDPKDAGVMLSTLAVGLASGVGLWMLAIFGTVFILLVLWVVESFEPVAMRRFTLRVKAKNLPPLKAKIEAHLKRQHATFQVSAVTPGELHYDVCWPLDRESDKLSERISQMDPSADTEVELDQKKDKT
jgi:hypothetical protein